MADPRLLPSLQGLTLNQRLFDRSVRHALFLHGLRKTEVARIARILNERIAPQVLATLQSRMARISARGVDPGPAVTKRLEDLLDSVDAIVRTGFREMGDEATKGQRDLALTEAEWQSGLLAETVRPFGLTTTAPAPAQLIAGVRARPFQGLVMKDWWAGVEKGSRDLIRGTIQDGFIAGQTTPEIVARLAGSEAEGAFAGKGALGRIRSNVEAVTRTALNHTATVARHLTYEANDDVLAGWQFVATLDTRTTLICANLDGTIWKLGEGPLPPRHYGCRSGDAPVLKTAAELGLSDKDFGPGERASMFGPVAETVKYPEWLKGQPDWVQDMALGPTRAALFREGKLELKDFQAADGQPLTIAELRKLEGLPEKPLGEAELERAALATAERAGQAEPDISASLLSVVGGKTVPYEEALKGPAAPAGGDMAGFENRLKTRESLQKKIGLYIKEDAEEGKTTTAAEAAEKVWDAVRYTVRLNPDEYWAGVRRVADDLIAKGNVPVRGKWKDTWDNPTYKGLNTNWTAPNGTKFELQFHTPQSFATKEANHGEYNLTKGMPDGPEKTALFEVMDARSRAVERPPGDAVFVEDLLHLRERDTGQLTLLRTDELEARPAESGKALRERLTLAAQEIEARDQRLLKQDFALVEEHLATYRAITAADQAGQPALADQLTAKAEQLMSDLTFVRRSREVLREQASNELRHALRSGDPPARATFGLVPSPASSGIDATAEALAQSKVNAAWDFIAPLVSQRATGGKDLTVAVRVAPQHTRAYHAKAAAGQPFGSLINVPAADPVHNWAHELGHAVEIQWLGDKAAKHLGERAATDPRGFRWLGDIHPGLPYGKEEVAVEDRFATAYMGKRYAGLGYSATEIVSVGLELLTKDPIAFMRKDPETFDWLIDALRGRL